MVGLLIPILALMMIRFLVLGNDYNDPFFVAIGIDSPWYVALGNHDVLHVGGFGID